MNFAEIQNAWQSPHNQPAAAELEKQKMELVQTLHRRDRGFVIGMTLIVAALVLMTGLIVRNQMIGGSPDTIDFKREWSAIVFFGLPWFGAIWILLRYRRLLKQQGNYTGSIADSVSALLEQNRFAQAKTRLILILQAVSLPIIALVIYQLQAVDKMRPHEAISAAMLFGGAMLLALSCMLWELFRKLRPEQRRLEGLLTEYAKED